MEKIILKKREVKPVKRRSSVVIKPETYMEIYNLSLETNITIEAITDLLLTKALALVEIQ